MPELCVCCGAPAPKTAKDRETWEVSPSFIGAQPGDVGTLSFPLCEDCGLAVKELNKQTPLWPSLITGILVSLGVYRPAVEEFGSGMGRVVAFFSFAVAFVVVNSVLRDASKLKISEVSQLKLTMIEHSVQLEPVFLTLTNLQFATEFQRLNEKRGVRFL